MTSEEDKDICENCGAEIPTDSDSCPNCRPKRKKADALPVILVIAVLCSSLLLLSTSVVNVASLPDVPPQEAPAAPVPPSDLSVAAFEAAKGFINHTYPGPKQFSPISQASIDQKENIFTVTLSADDIGGNAPVRYFFSVEMEVSSAGWKLREIKR